MDGLFEDDGLWDELSHQQSREIEQHRARTALRPSFPADLPSSATTSNSNSSGGNLKVVERVARRAADEVGRFTEHVYRSTITAYQNHQRQQQRNSLYRTVPTTNRGGGYLDDFGISTTPGEDPLLTPLAASTGGGGDYSAGSSPTAAGAPQQPGTNRDNNGAFVVLPKQDRRPVADGWGAVSNLDLYLSSLYTYYYHQGLVPVVGKGIVELVTLFLTLYLSVFLFVHVDWPKLATCIDESTCHADFFEGYYIARPKSSWTIWNMLVRLYFLIFLAYGLFSLWSFCQSVQDAMFAKRVFEDRLGIPAHKLEGGAVDWDRDVVAKLCELQQTGEYRIAIDDQHQLDALTVANRILRKENFFVALINRGVLDLSVPFIGHGLLCTSLEWSLYFCIFNFMFNHKFNIRPAFYVDPMSLKRRFVLCGIAHLLFMPFLLFFMLLYFGLRNAYDWKSTKQYLGPREWSLTAKWTFREFNELPHFFERRLAPSYQAAEDYLKLFGQNEMMTAAGRILVFFGGSIGIVLFGFAAINDAILLHVKIADWNLLWYAGMAGIVYSTGKSMLPANDKGPGYIRNIYAERDSALANVANHTHYYPDIWKGRGWDKINHKAFLSMYKPKAQLFLQEILALILSPYILCISLPRCAEQICEFVLALKAEIPGAGEVCGYATFDFDIYGDETWEGRTLGNNNNPLESSTGSLTKSVITLGYDEASKRHPKPKARNGKMEKSFFGFKGSNPSWKVPDSGQHLVDRVEQYRRQETAARALEQQLHIEAAARQLETLARLEHQKALQSSTIHVNIPGNLSATDATAHFHQSTVNESYFPRSGATADAGAGLFQSNTLTRSGMDVKRPPPMAAFSHLTLPRTLSEQRNTSNDTEDSDPDPAPFALNLEPSTISVPPLLSSRPSAAGGFHSTDPSPATTRSIPVTGHSLAMSADILRLLNMSTLETGSLLDETSSIHSEERQYMWLERYHAHIAAQKQQQTSGNQPSSPWNDTPPSNSPNIV